MTVTASFRRLETSTTLVFEIFLNIIPEFSTVKANIKVPIVGPLSLGKIITITFGPVWFHIEEPC